MPDPFRLGRKVGLFGGDGRISQGVNEFLARRASWMAFVRRDTRFPCPCWDPATKSPDPECEVCFGLGYKVRIEKHLVRRTLGPQTAASPQVGPGYLAKYLTVIYTPRAYAPQSSDLYLEVEWDVPEHEVERKGKAVRLIHSYRVDEAVAMKEDEVSFMACGCDNFDLHHGKLSDFILNVGTRWSPAPKVY